MRRRQATAARVVLGSLVDPAPAEPMDVLIADAVAKGVKVVAGGKRNDTVVEATLFDGDFTSACSLRTRLPPRRASFPSVRLDSNAGTFSSAWPARRSAAQSLAAPARPQSTASDGYGGLGSDRAYPSAAPLPPKPSASSASRRPAGRNHRWRPPASRSMTAATDARAGSWLLACSWRNSRWSRRKAGRARSDPSARRGSRESSIAQQFRARRAGPPPRRSAGS